MRVILTGGVIAGVLAAGAAWACQPCPGPASLTKTVADAELIAMVEAKTGVLSNPEGKDGYITVTVERTLKGKATGKTISVKSWHGMCPYGLFMDKGQRAVVFLTREGERFEALSARCGVSGLRLTDGKVTAEGASLRVDEFAARYGLTSRP